MKFSNVNLSLSCTYLIFYVRRGQGPHADPSLPRVQGVRPHPRADRQQPQGRDEEAEEEEGVQRTGQLDSWKQIKINPRNIIKI